MRTCCEYTVTKIHEELSGPYGVLENIPGLIGVGVTINTGDDRIGSTIDEIKFPSYSRVAFIQRLDPDGERVTLAANSDRVLQEGDRLLCFLPPDRFDDFMKRVVV